MPGGEKLVTILPVWRAYRQQRRIGRRGNLSLHQRHTRLERGKIHSRHVKQRVNREGHYRNHSNGKRTYLYARRLPHALERHKGHRPQGAKHHILYKRLEMSQMYSLSKAAAVHRWILDPQNQGKHGEKQQQHSRHHRGNTGAHTGKESRTHYRLQHSEQNSRHFGDRSEEAQMEEVEILPHHQRCAHGVHQLEQSRAEQDEAGHERTNPLNALHILHAV